MERALELLAKADNGRAALAGAAQPYADFLVESALLALPWGGASLWDAEPTAADAILSQVQEYLAARPRKVWTAYSENMHGIHRTSAKY